MRVKMKSFKVTLVDGRIVYVKSYTKGEVPVRLELMHDTPRDMIASVRADKGDPAPRFVAKRAG